MSKFNPASWLNRSRLFSDSSGDFSANNDSSLAGLNYASQSSIGSGNNGLALSPSPAQFSRKTINNSNNRSLDQSQSQDQGIERILTEDGLIRQWNYGEGSNQRHDDDLNMDMGNLNKVPPTRPLTPPRQHHVRHASLPAMPKSNTDAVAPIRRPYTAQTNNHGTHFRKYTFDESDCSEDQGSIDRNESFGNSSIISGLSADDTLYSHEGKNINTGVRAVDVPHDRRHRVHPLLKPKDKTGGIPKGRDFGNAFDHLVDDLNDQELDEANNCYRVTTASDRKRRHNGNVRKPQHLRSQSDTAAFRPKVYSQSPSQFMKSRTLPAHATLRERINRNAIPKPQLLQSRSTSNTVSISSAGTSNGGGVDGVNHGVWNGQPVDNVRVEDGQPIAHSSSVDNSETSTSSNSGYAKHNSLLGTRPRRRLHPNNPRVTDDYDEKSLQDVPEGNASTKWDDMKSVDGRSVLSNNSTSTSGQRKRVIRDEIKFIVTRFVPSRLRKIKSNKSVTLERSEGCLT